MIKFIKGNIFNTQCKVLVNTVNCVGVMGKGMAFECKQRFPDMYKNYEKKCQQGELSPGKLHLWNKSNPWILNFPTKVDWKHPSKIEYLKLGLEKFKQTYSDKAIESIAFPLLGSSLGGLDKNDVIKVMRDYLEPISEIINIEVYEFDKSATDKLFESFSRQTRNFTTEDYQKYLKINKVQANNLYEAINNGTLKTMLGIQDVPQVGLKAIEKIHQFVKNSSDLNIQSKLEFDE